MNKTKFFFMRTDFFLAVITIALIVCTVLIILSGSSQSDKRSENHYEQVPAAAPPVAETAKFIAAEYPFTGKINGTGVRLREKPNVQTGKIIRELNDAVRVEVLGKEGPWYLVKLKDEEGYIYEDYISRAQENRS